MSINGLICQRQGVSLMPHADDGSFYMLVFEHNIIFNAEFNICFYLLVHHHGNTEGEPKDSPLNDGKKMKVLFVEYSIHEEL